MQPKPFIYNAKVDSIYDGDTISVILDLGMSISVKRSCRLFGIDTPEIRTKIEGEKEAAEKARDRLRELIWGKEIVVESIEKPDKYGRLLARIWVDNVCVNDTLVNEHFAKPYDGGAKISWAEWT